MIDVASTGPSHSLIAGTTSPVVLPDWVGPTTITEARSSAAISARRWCPSVILPGSGRRTRSSARSDRVAHFADRLRGAASRSRLARRQASTTAAATVMSEISSDRVELPGAGELSPVRGRPRQRRVRQVREEPGEERARL